MDNTLMVLGALLGIVVPALFAFALCQGVKCGWLEAKEKTAYCRNVVAITALWTFTVWVLSLTHVIAYQRGDRWPRIALPLFVPVIVALLLLLNATIKKIVLHAPLSVLVGVQTFRLAGFVFLIIPGLGHLPLAFKSGGYGDIATGLLAILGAITIANKARGARITFALFTVVGLLDLLNVAILLFYYYPAWNGVVPSSAALTDFSLVMVPALAAPMALILHIFAISNFVFGKWRDQR